MTVFLNFVIFVLFIYFFYKSPNTEKHSRYEGDKENKITWSILGQISLKMD